MTHENRDLDPRIVRRSIGGFLLLAILSALASTLIVEPRKGKPGNDWPVPASERPRAPGDDLKDLRARERKLLHEYAWVDRAAGTVRIPIERAMDLIAERGLPARKGNGR